VFSLAARMGLLIVLVIAGLIAAALLARALRRPFK